MKALEDPPLFSLVIPTYNEKENLPHLMARLTRTLNLIGCKFEIIIVDDNSPDETWKLAAEMALKEPRLKVIRRQGQRGLATAAVAGWKKARGQILGVMDGDLQHPPEILPELLKAITDTPGDITVASRYAPGARVEQCSLLRKILSRSAVLLAKLVLPGRLTKLSDPTSGYFVMRRSVFEHLDLCPRGFKILVEVLARGRYQGVVEVPYVFEGRKKGKSKLGSQQYIEFFLHLARLAWDTGKLGRFLRSCAACLIGGSIREKRR